MPEFKSSPADREEMQVLATAIVAAARANEPLPLPGLRPIPQGSFFDCGAVESFVLKLARENERLRVEHEALTKLYAAAARLRTFPVPFDDHFELVGAVDECRSILEPPIDTYGEAYP